MIQEPFIWFAFKKTTQKPQSPPKQNKTTKQKQITNKEKLKHLVLGSFQLSLFFRLTSMDIMGSLLVKHHRFL